MSGDARSYPATEGANWTLHRQPDDQMVDHRFSIWSGEHPVVLANEMPGEEGALAYIVDVLNRGGVDPAQGQQPWGASLERLRDLADLLNDPASKRKEYYAPLLHRFREELPSIIRDLSVSRPDRKAGA